MKPTVEIEIKATIATAAAGRALLRRNGFAVITKRVFEENLVLDDPGRGLLERGLLLRVRRAGKLITCTTKGAGLPGRHKRREEHEFTASGFDACLAVFAALGYREAFRYEKYRSVYGRPGENGRVMLDETPIGTYLEIEGPARWIDSTAKRLGFAPEIWIMSSYVTLYTEWCAQQGIEPTGMRFVERKQG